MPNVGSLTEWRIIEDDIFWRGDEKASSNMNIICYSLE